MIHGTHVDRRKKNEAMKPDVSSCNQQTEEKDKDWDFKSTTQLW